MSESTEAPLSGIDLNTITEEDFRTALDTDLALRTDYLHNSGDQKYTRINNILDGVEPEAPVLQEQEAKAPAASPQGDAATPGTLDVSLKVDPKLLGTYLTNRTPEEAVIEALRGKVEADRFIETQRGSISSLSAETLKLRRELEATRKATAPQVPAPQAPQPQAAAPKTPQVNVDELKDLDLFDPENQKKVFDTIGALAAQVQTLQTAPPKPETPPVIPPTPAQQNKANPQLQKHFMEDEIRQIQELQYAIPEYNTSRPIMDIDADVAKAYAQMQRLGGSADLYFAQTAAGEQFRSQCAASNVALPKEFDQWFGVMSFREQRQTDLGKLAKDLSSRTGADIKMYDVMDTPNHGIIDYYKRSAPKTSANAPSSRLQANIEQRRVSQAAAALPEEVVPEIPSNMGQPITDISTWTEDMMQTLLKKNYNAMTREEAAQAIEIMKLVDEKPPQVLLNKVK
jgi:hypothetical protein